VIEYPPVIELRDKLIIIYPNKKDYDLSLEIMIKLRKVGKPVGSVDILISAIAINRGLTLVTNDKDFFAIKEVEPRLVIEYS